MKKLEKNLWKKTQSYRTIKWDRPNKNILISLLHSREMPDGSESPTKGYYFCSEQTGRN